MPPTGGLGHRDRPAGDAAGQRRLDPRGDPLPDAAPRVRPAPGWRAGRGAAAARRADAHRTGQRRRSEASTARPRRPSSPCRAWPRRRTPHAARARASCTRAPSGRSPGSPRSAACSSCSAWSRSCTRGSARARTRSGRCGCRIVGHVVSVIVGLLLILLADQLGKRKHAAWRVGGGAVRGRRRRAPASRGRTRSRWRSASACCVALVAYRTVLRRAGRPAVAVPPRPVRAAVPARRAGLRRRRALDGARPDHPGR